jgi:hypothetical protein
MNKLIYNHSQSCITRIKKPNSIKTSVPLSTITSLRVFSCTFISVTESFTMRMFYHAVSIKGKLCQITSHKKDVHYTLHYCTSCVLQHHKTCPTVWQYHNRIVSDITTNEKYQHQFFIMLLKYITAFKKNACCGEIIPTNVSFQLCGNDNWSKCRHRPACSIMRVSKIIYCLSDYFIIAPLAVSELCDLLRSFLSSPYFLSVVSVLHVSSHAIAPEGETWWSHWPGE